MLPSICQKIWKNQQGPQDWKRSVFISVPNKGNDKECSNYCTIALINFIFLGSKITADGDCSHEIKRCLLLGEGNGNPLQYSFLPGKFHGPRSLVGYSPWGRKESDTTEWLHSIPHSLLLGRKVMTNLDSILKSGDITLPTKVHLVKAMIFPVGMYGCESWTVKKAKRQKIGAFELWCWRRLLRVPWTARRSKQSILKEISPGC